MSKFFKLFISLFFVFLSFSFIIFIFFSVDFLLYYSKSSLSFDKALPRYIDIVHEELFDISSYNNISKKNLERNVLPKNVLDVEYTFNTRVESYKYNSKYAFLRLEGYSYPYAWIRVSKEDLEAYFHYLDKGFNIKGICYKNYNNEYYFECNYDFYNPSEG